MLPVDEQERELFTKDLEEVVALSVLTHPLIRKLNDQIIRHLIEHHEIEPMETTKITVLCTAEAIRRVSIKMRENFELFAKSVKATEANVSVELDKIVAKVSHES